MSKVEFLQMVPALLYGISLAEISMYLGNIFRKKERMYWEHLAAIILAFETIIFNWYIFYDRLETLNGNYLSFIIQLLPPIFFFIFAANILIDNKDEDGIVKNMFLNNRKQIFASLSLFVAVNLGTVYYFTPHLLPPVAPLVVLALVASNIFVDSVMLRSTLYVAKTAQIIFVLFNR